MPSSRAVFPKYPGECRCGVACPQAYEEERVEGNSQVVASLLQDTPRTAPVQFWHFVAAANVVCYDREMECC